MTRLFALQTTRAAVLAIAAIAATTVPVAKPAEAGWRDISISIGDGYGSGIHIGRSCRYYYKKAVATGDAYWWDRYYDCRSGH